MTQNTSYGLVASLRARLRRAWLCCRRHGDGAEPPAGTGSLVPAGRGRRRPTSPGRSSVSTTPSRTSPPTSPRPMRAACCGARPRNAGTVSVKKPGKMRWDYTSPEKKLFVSDGQTMFLYFPNEKQVMKNAVPSQDQATSAVLFLMGKGNITRDFNVRWADGRLGHDLPAAARSKDPSGRVRLARNHRRPRDPAHRRIDGGRRPGGQILVHFQQFQGKRGIGR